MTFSDGGQEEWIERYHPENGWAVDVGANDGVFQSNTLAAEQRGWEVLCVEANPQYEIPLRTIRKRVEICAVSSITGERKFYINRDYPPAGSSLERHGDQYVEISVIARTLDQLLFLHQFPRLDLLSIDVEHTELDVLRSIDLLKWKPAMVVVESHSWDHDPVSANVVEQSLCDHLGPFGYRRKARTKHDLLFLRNE